MPMEECEAIRIKLEDGTLLLTLCYWSFCFHRYVLVIVTLSNTASISCVQSDLVNSYEALI